MGTMANELSLGSDCLGQIHYLVSHPISESISDELELTSTITVWRVHRPRRLGCRDQERHLYP